MNAIGLYDTMVMGYRVKVQPYKIITTFYRTNNEL